MAAVLFAAGLMVVTHAQYTASCPPACLRGDIHPIHPIGHYGGKCRLGTDCGHGHEQHGPRHCGRGRAACVLSGRSAHSPLGFLRSVLVWWGYVSCMSRVSHV